MPPVSAPRGGVRVLIALAALTQLLACSQIREDVGQPIVVDVQSLEAIHSYGEALAAFGPPHGVVRSGASLVFFYEEIDLVETQFGISLSTGDVSLLKAVAARGTAAHRLLVFIFDDEGRVQSARYAESQQDSGQGAALQLLFAVAGIVEDDDFSLSPPSHHWGLQLLQPDLPVALNRAQALDAGTGGLEQRGTPTAVGQKTLELAR